MFFKKNGFSKVIAFAICATMVFGSSITAFADEPTPGTTSTPGSGNILAYNNETYIVPTALKVALNPNGLSVNIRYKKTADTTVDADKTYYTYDSANDKYVYVAEPVDSACDTYYEADQSVAQVVSFNYGIVNESTKDKKVNITLEVAGNSANTGDGFSDITFVDSAADATAKTSASDETGAGFGELKMFLRITPSTAAPTAKTYAVTEDEDYDSDKTYYTYNSTTKSYDKASITEFAEGTVYFERVETEAAIDKYICKEDLADVKMTAVADAKKIAFKAGTTANTASGSIAYKLDKSTYGVKTGEIVDWSTTQAQLADKMELTTVSGTAAFTIDGVMNTNADWTKAKSTVLTITPTYDVKDADGTETAIADAGYNQIKTAADIAADAQAAADAAAAEAQAAVNSAVNTYKTTHADVVALLADPTAVDGTEGELTKINAAITAFEALDATEDAAIIAALAANEPSITAATLAALKAASEEAAVPAVTTYALTRQTNGNLTYSFSQNSLTPPTGTFSAVMVNGTGRAGKITSGDISYNATNGFFKISAAAVTDLGLEQGSTTVIATIGDADYTFTY